MKSIEKRFNKIKIRNPYYSSIICFNLAVEKQDFCEQIIARWFNKLVEKDDYSSKDKKDIFAFLYALTKSPEECQKQG